MFKKLSISKKAIIRILALMLIFTLTFSNFSIFGKEMVNAITSYALDFDLTDNETNEDNVKFEVYINDEETKEVSQDINSDSVKVGIKIWIENGGYLENGKIEFLETNFKIKDNENLSSFDLEKIQSGNYLLKEFNIIAKKEEKYDIDLLNMVSKIKLTGNYINNKGKSKQIEAVKGIRIVWNAQDITQENNPVLLNQEVIAQGLDISTNKKYIQIKVTSGIDNNLYPIKDTQIKLNIPKLENNNEAIPEKIVVASLNTNATNGKTSLDFGEDEEKSGFWLYDEEDKNVLINVKNVRKRRKYY